MAGEDAVKAGGEKYLPRLDSQTDEEFAAYVKRASFFNASARTSEAYLGLMFRRPPFVKLPEAMVLVVGRAMAEFANDADMLGTSLTGYAKKVVGEVIGLGRAGTLVDWEDEVEQRAYAVFYRAEQIINWRVERVNGRNVPTLIVLKEQVHREARTRMMMSFELRLVDQMRVLRLVPGDGGRCRWQAWTTTARWSCGSRRRRSGRGRKGGVAVGGDADAAAAGQAAAADSVCVSWAAAFAAGCGSRCRWRTSSR